MRHRRQILLTKMMLPPVVTGASILALVHYFLLPLLARELTATQLEWLREAFMAHPVWLLFAMLVVVAVLCLPVALVAWLSVRRLRLQPLR